jgi:excisionase family DNA binding protein
MSSPAEWFTTAEVAMKTGLTQRHIRRLCNTGELVCVHRGNTYLIDPESLRQYEATRTSRQGKQKEKSSETG